MKSKFILSLVLAACISLSAAAMVTNANFTAVATSTGNTITMGTVQLKNESGQVGQTIEMGSLFNIPNLGSTSAPVTTTKSIAIAGTLPVKLSLGTYSDNLGKVDEVTVSPTGVISTWWRHYKSNVLVSVKRAATGDAASYTSRPDSVQGGFDSIFDTIEGTAHTPSTENTIGINDLLGDLGTLYPGDLVTITTKTEFSQTAYYTTNAPENVTAGGPARIDGDYTLTQDQLNAFQGQSLAINLKLIATEQ